MCWSFAAGVLIVGAGPSGYAAAMALAKCGFRDITLIESSESADAFEATKAFVYSVSPAGKRVLDMLGMPTLDSIGALFVLVLFLFQRVLMARDLI